MSRGPGSIYKVGGRRYADSQVVLNLASEHELVPLPDGWRVLVGGGAVRCTAAHGRPALPGQRGALYELSAEGSASLKVQRTAWISRGLAQAAGTFDTWPGSPEVKAGCGCGKTCGCAPCRLRHAGHD